MTWNPVAANKVAVAVTDAPAYPDKSAAPFGPAGDFPELDCRETGRGGNAGHALVRRVLADLGLDAANFGSARWNPLGALVPPGALIVVKPNWVLDHNEGRGGTDCLITHAAILRAVLDYAFLARPRAVVVGDAPLQGCDFAALLSLGAGAVAEFYRQAGLPLRVEDFRRTRLRRDGFAVHVSEDVREPAGFVLVDLGRESALEPIAHDYKKFRVTMYDPRRMREHHCPGKHEYLVAKDILDADLVINLPKLKTHKKAGITGALKNLVGINGNKDYLPHHRKGSAAAGGDNYPRRNPLKWAAEAMLDHANRHLHRPRYYAWMNRLVYGLLVLDMKLGGTGDVEGSWSGNDTVWRTCLDLNRILLYADRAGHLQSQPQRQVLSIVDAVIAGQGDGPLRPDPLPLGVLLGGLNAAAVDWVGAALLGMEPAKIPIVARAFVPQANPLAAFPPEEIACACNGQGASLRDLLARCAHPAAVPRGWRSARAA